MGTTPTLGLPYPDPGSLVQLIDENIRDLALAVEALHDVRMATGRYFRAPATTVPATSWAGGPAVGTMSLYPMVVWRTGTIDRIGINVQTLSATGLARMGLYANNGGLPGALLVDGGTVACSTVGAKTVTVAQPVKYGQVVWVAIACQVAVWQALTISGGINPDVQPGDPALANTDRPAYEFAGITGALPNPLPALATGPRAFQPFLRLA